MRNMKRTMTGAAFLLASVSATGIWATLNPYDGNDIVANGSDTLFNVTQSVLSMCPNKFADFNLHPLRYLGGGSGTGAAAMLANTQQTSPMSRALRNTEYCTATIDFDGSNGPEAARAAVDTATGLLVGLDGIAVNASATTTCGPNGVATGGSFNITATTGTPGTCPGCDAGNATYTINSAFDVLRLVYGGLHHDGTYDCNSNVRRSLVANWGALFSAACPAGNATCTAGLTHAWRRSDLSGTTDTFVSLVGFTGRAIGSSPLATASFAQNPFCNSIDANMPVPAFPVCSATVPCPQGFSCVGGSCAGPACCTAAGCAPTVNCPTGFACSSATTTPGVCNRSLGGRSDFADFDPVRVACGNTPDQISCNADGRLGLVLPILLPDTTNVTVADAFPADTCTAGACELEAPAASTQVTLQRVICPDGNLPATGRCFAPYRLNPDGTRNYQCRAGRITNRCFGLAANGNDGRAYNRALIKPSAARPAEYATDNLGRLMTASFFRYRQNPTLATPCRTDADDTSQIGCLTNADGCSLGFSGRASAPPGSNKALSVAGIFPTDQNIRNLLSNTPPVYPLSRRLFFNTLRGFGNLAGNESEFAQCYGDNNIVRTALLADAFVSLPSPGIQCLNYDATLPTTATPLPGCGAATDVNGCLTAPPVIGPTTAEVQAILNNRCISCHGGAAPSAGLNLTNVAAIVGTASGQCATKLRINPGNSAQSYLVDKIIGSAQDGGCFTGLRMPRNGPPFLTDAEIALIAAWIDKGAN